MDSTVSPITGLIIVVLFPSLVALVTLLIFKKLENWYGDDRKGYYSLDHAYTGRVLDESDSLSPSHRAIMDLSVFQKIKCFVDLCDDEINGFGRVERISNDFFITDPFILKQTTIAGGMHVETDDMALNKFIYELVKKGEDHSKIKFQWHSHVNSSAFFSAEDKSTITGYMNDFMISFVINKRGEYECRLDLFQPFYVGLKVPLLISLPLVPEETKKNCTDDIKRLVKIEPFVGLPLAKKAKVNNDKEITLTIIPHENLLEEGGFDELLETDRYIESE